MDNLIRILRSFSKGEEDSVFTENFIDILKSKVMNDVQKMYERGLTFRNNSVIIPHPWESIYASLKEIGFFKRFVPVSFGGNRANEEIIYFILQLKRNN